DIDRLVRRHGDDDVLAVIRFAGVMGGLRQLHRYAAGDDGRYDHEDDEKHQHDIDQRRDVDVRFDLVLAARLVAVRVGLQTAAQAKAMQTLGGDALRLVVAARSFHQVAASALPECRPRPSRSMVSNISPAVSSTSMVISSTLSMK